MLRLLPKEFGVGVWKNKNATVTLDRAEPASRVARQARVPKGIDVASANTLANLNCGATGTLRVAGVPCATSVGTLSAVSAGVSLADPNAGLPVSISGRVTNPLLRESSRSPVSHISK